MNDVEWNQTIKRKNNSTNLVQILRYLYFKQNTDVVAHNEVFGNIMQILVSIKK